VNGKIEANNEKLSECVGGFEKLLNHREVCVTVEFSPN
jgi:hypothetical protein